MHLHCSSKMFKDFFRPNCFRVITELMHKYSYRTRETHSLFPALMCQCQISKIKHSWFFYCCRPAAQVGKNTHFWEINISMRTAEFVICIQNLWKCTVNEEILKNVINIARYSLYPRTQRPVNDEPLNTFGSLELPLPISKPLWKKHSLQVNMFLCSEFQF